MYQVFYFGDFSLDCVQKGDIYKVAFIGYRQNGRQNLNNTHRINLLRKLIMSRLSVIKTQIAPSLICKILI